jgi:transcriptional regulator with XRE-family HTH domain
LEDAVSWNADPSGLAGRRIAAGLSQDDLAARLGVTRNYISMVERGHRTVSPRIAPAWAAALDVDEPTLHDLEGTTPPDYADLADRIRAAVTPADLATLRAARDPAAPYETYERAAGIVHHVIEAAFTADAADATERTTA